jgi:hypothetical protein
MARKVEKTVFSFDELSDNAKDTARDWYRRDALDYGWFDAVYENAEQCGALLGISINKKKNGSPVIYSSGFSSQGDGACFEGSYSYRKGALTAIKTHAPFDIELHHIAKALQDIQRRHFYRLEATMAQRGHYYHSGCMTVDVEPDDSDEGIKQCMRDFADWTYKMLKTEHDYLMSDEQVDESIKSNEYEFSEDGTIF